MKSKLFIFAFLVFCVSSIEAQQSWGLKGGWALSNLSTKDGKLDDSKARNGFTLGVYGNYPLLGIFSFQPELLYTQKGGLVERGSTSIDTESGYIDIPLGLQLNVMENLYFYVGPQFSVLTNIKVTYKVGTISLEVDKNESNYNRIDAGIMGGLGIRNQNLFIDARVSRGMVDYNDDSTILSFQEDIRNLTNFTFALTAGFRF